jgi:hypothetical protein
MLSWVSCASTVQGSNVNELGATLNERPSAVLVSVVLLSSGLAPHDVHRTLESVQADIDEAEGTRSGGGVIHLRGGDVKYDLLRKSHSDIKSDVPSITPFNLIPYLSNM